MITSFGLNANITIYFLQYKKVSKLPYMASFKKTRFFPILNFFKGWWHLVAVIDHYVVRRPLVLGAPSLVTCSAPCSCSTPIVQVCFRRIYNNNGATADLGQHKKQIYFCERIL